MMNNNCGGEGNLVILYRVNIHCSCEDLQWFFPVCLFCVSFQSLVQRQPSSKRASIGKDPCAAAEGKQVCCVNTDLSNFTQSSGLWAKSSPHHARHDSQLRFVQPRCRLGNYCTQPQGVRQPRIIISETLTLRLSTSLGHGCFCLYSTMSVVRVCSGRTPK